MKNKPTATSMSCGPSTANELLPLPSAYAAQFDAQAPLAEYPRPQLVRAPESWRSLNGIWRYAIRKGGLPDSGLKRISVPDMDGEICVPYAPEALLSGVQRRLLPDEVLWYEKVFDSAELPACRAKSRIRLHFGAVDQSCRVFLNERFVGENHGGYYAFNFDITSFLRAGANVLRLAVVDPSQTGDWGYGKQTLERGKIWYSPSSGIWQTVWLEAVPASYISMVEVTPDCPSSTIHMKVIIEHPHSNQIRGQIETSNGPVPFQLRSFTSSFDPPQLEVELEASLPSFKAWSPEDPHLYHYELRHENDVVRGYFAMREFGLGKDANGIPRLLLNGQVYMHVGVLDQGYWSDGMYTPPCDQAMIDDISAMKALGFNMLRKHIKIEPARWYYHCDRLGMLVWQDMVSGGGPYRFSVIGLLPFLGIHLKDGKTFPRFGRASSRSRANFEDELRRTVAQLYSVPSIALWVPFNEGWGQFEALRIYELLRSLDPTRPIDHASGWHDQGGGDLCSRHVYFKKVRLKPDRLGRPWALSEFGGYTFGVEGHMSSTKVYGYKPYADLESYQAGVLALYDDLLSDPRRLLAATVYTQLSDVEDECNGILTYDRKISKWPAGSKAAAALRARLEALRRL